jgi:hypothetical protein
VFVNQKELRVEDCIDLSDNNILYHFFHEHPWDFPINTGVKIVNKKALKENIDLEIFSRRNTPPWNQFPWEQKVMAEWFIPNNPSKYKIHDPYVLNYILYQKITKDKHSPIKALFIHMCARTTEQRNKIMNVFENENRIMNYQEYQTITIF